MSNVITLPRRADGAEARCAETLAGVLVELRAHERLNIANRAHVARIAGIIGVGMDAVERRADAIERERSGGWLT